MHAEFTLEKNDWQIQDPAWEKISHVWTKELHWHSYGISNFWLQDKYWNGRLKERFSISCPSTAEHMYFIWWNSYKDYIFASYSLSEIKRFLQLDADAINKNYWKHDGMCSIFFIYDMVQKKWYAFKHDNLDVYCEVGYPLASIEENANKIEVNS